MPWVNPLTVPQCLPARGFLRLHTNFQGIRGGMKSNEALTPKVHRLETDRQLTDISANRYFTSGDEKSSLWPSLKFLGQSCEIALLRGLETKCLFVLSTISNVTACFLFPLSPFGSAIPWIKSHVCCSTSECSEQIISVQVLQVCGCQHGSFPESHTHLIYVSDTWAWGLLRRGDWVKVLDFELILWWVESFLDEACVPVMWNSANQEEELWQAK